MTGTDAREAVADPVASVASVASVMDIGGEKTRRVVRQVDLSQVSVVASDVDVVELHLLLRRYLEEGCYDGRFGLIDQVHGKMGIF